MKAMILAAGRGARLKPLTNTMPKPLIEIGGRALLDYHLDKLATAGVKDVVINTCWLADQLHQHINRSNYPTLNITISHEIEALETAGGIRHALPLLGTGPFLVISADVWSEFDYRHIIKKYQYKLSMAHLFLVENPQHNINGDYALTGTQLSHIDKQGYTYSGVGVFNPTLFTMEKFKAHKKLALREVINCAIDKKSATAELLKQAWFDIGTVERLEALEIYLEKKAK